MSDKPQAAGSFAQAAPDIRRPVRKGEVLHADLCIIGAGSGGLSVAAGAVQMGARVVLIERGRMGGDCLNTGCVPSKALIAAAHAAHVSRQASHFGVLNPEPVIDFARVHAHVRGTIAAIAPHDSVERFEGLGVQVIQAPARFVAPDMVEADGQRIRARRFVVATGSRAAVPPIPGLRDVPFLTNETLFDLTSLPGHLIVLGGGPIGIEMAQAFRRLGSAVTVVEGQRILSKDDPDAVAVVRAALLAEGVVLHEGVRVEAVSGSPGNISLRLAEGDAGTPVITGTHLLVAAGRRPNIDDLGLDAAGIAFSPRGITVDAGLRTSNRAVFAMGDVAGGPQFTHVAGYHAGIIIRSALFGLPAKVDYTALPWVTYTDPELAHTGLTAEAARAAGHEITVLPWSFAQNDRAQAERDTQGLARIVVGKGGRILGATLVGPRAGELIGLWALAIASRRRIGAIAQMIAPYPTLSEVSKRVAGSYYSPSLFSPRTRWIVRLIQRWLP